MVRLPAGGGERPNVDLTGVSPLPSADGRGALRVHVTGVVQGVGFRPFVHRLALRHELGGWVCNRAGDVEIHVEGLPPEVAAFLAELEAEAPPLARIDELRAEAARPGGLTDFSIERSRDAPDERQPVSPDVAICAACEAELFDPSNRRYGYAFITCTDCGPRFTVIRAMPYDRERTSMFAFTQCPDCLDEYRTPGNRRYHSETNSCPRCGPRLWLEIPRAPLPSSRRPPGDPIERAAALLRQGAIVAVRGLGGFHLAVDAADDAAVERLRTRKRREAKPLAIMVHALRDAQALGEVGDAEAALLTSAERPVVLLRRRALAQVAPSLAPGLDTVGVMLAYTPLHHLLLERVGRPLVMTSGNVSEEPIATGNEEALRRLADIADAFLLHDREIAARYDDSVVRVAGATPIFLRRARGYAPLPLRLPVAAPLPLLAVGPHLKNTFTLVHGRDAYVSQHVGDLENLETLEHFEASLETLSRLFRIVPEVVVRDLHPGYLSTRVAEQKGLAEVIAVQHHHAHVAAVMAEHGRTQPVVGIAYDGTGFGDDGCVWGAEVLVADLTGYRRAAQLRYAPLPGGDAAARRPWRAALGYLSLEPDAAPAFARAFRGVDRRGREIAERQITAGVNAPVASSMGRLFDAAAAVLGVRTVAHYEGQAAMELEALAGVRSAHAWPLPLLEASVDPPGGLVLDPLPLLQALGMAAARGSDPAELAATFHESVAAATARVAARVAEESGTDTIAVGGGVFQNARLLQSVRARLKQRGLSVLAPRRLSPNDGAISYGQAAVAAARLVVRA
ncbi:MAG: carbamoyltransferase HypF [Gemmatimonadetes bacterium]|nr:carbamoyltransferase HypF [Gemmatimonadota bacterium]